ncbi:cysteine synthase A [bacterium]|nr:cysteine synthase A [bacterium]
MRSGQHIYNLIGQTPVVKANRIVGKNDATLWMKLESSNPAFSVKDRIALAMIETAEKDGSLKPGGVVIEGTSGNTGIGLAMVCAAKGYRCILVMPETMSMERRRLLQAYGAELVLTPGAKGMKGTVEKADEIAAATTNSFVPRQFDNPANPDIHYRTTGPEIFEQVPGPIDAVCFGVGTGGTITGAGRFLKEKYPELKIFACEPKDSPLLSQGKPGPHKIQGWGPNFVPTILDTTIYDDVITVEKDEAFDMTRKLASLEGILAGISSGAAAHAAVQICRRLGKGKTVVTLLPDTGERYLSTELFPYNEP